MNMSRFGILEYTAIIMRVDLNQNGFLRISNSGLFAEWTF